MRRMIADKDGYNEEKYYKYIRYVVGLLNKTAFIRTKAYGTENLPKEGGYMMYPNHQGKYDAYGIVNVHEKPCTVVMDEAKSHTIFIRELLDTIRGKRLDKTDIRQSLTIINEVAKEVSQGRRYILFPEGDHFKGKKNTLSEFKKGCFKIPLKTKTPIVPVVLVDAYKVFNSPCLGKVTVQVHFLPPIFYDEYKDLKTPEIAQLVKGRIQEKLDELLGTK